MLLLAVCILLGCNSEFSDVDSRLRFAINTAWNSLGVASYRLPASASLREIPQDHRNPLSFTKIALGQQLYHESVFATIGNFQELRQTYSCATCHHSGAGFQAGIKQGIGDGGVGFGSKGEGRRPEQLVEMSKIDAQPLRTPSVLNSAYQTNMFWNGQFGATVVNDGTQGQWPLEGPIAINRLGYEGIETQAIAGITVHRHHYDQESVISNGYQIAFDHAFAERPINRRYNNETAGLAIAAYQRTLMANESPWQRWLRGEAQALTDEEKEGAILFFTKGQCK